MAIKGPGCCWRSYVEFIVVRVHCIVCIVCDWRSHDYLVVRI